jgi:cell fate (sporulation/competence/biofilm development) regulator YlbF (YheA/YmcA/DUF963 family)
MPDLHYIEHVATLCKKYSDLQYQVSEIKKLLQQPIDHDVDIQFSIDVHNKKQHEENAAAKKLNAITENPVIGLLREHYNIPAGITVKGQPCRHTMIFNCSEATSIIILTALLREKEAKRDKVLEEFHQLQNSNNRVSDSHITNPIIDLHETKP